MVTRRDAERLYQRMVEEYDAGLSAIGKTDAAGDEEAWNRVERAIEAIWKLDSEFKRENGFGGVGLCYLPLLHREAV